jgi:hypothetical protein
MSTIARFAVLLALSFAALSSTAGAVTWHNTGAEAFHADGNLLRWFITPPGGGIGLTCNGASTATGTAPVGTFSSAYSITGTLTNTPCDFSGASLEYFQCDYRFTASTQGATVPLVTSGAVDLTCQFRSRVADFVYCHWAGATLGQYTNPAAGTPGRLTLTATAAMTVTNVTTTSCSPFLGTATSSTGHLSERSFTLTTGGPFLTRTA